MEPVIIPIVPTVRTVPARLDHFAGTPATYRVSESALYPIAGADQLVIEVRAGRTDFTDPRAATVLATPTGAGPWDLDLTTAQWNQPLYEAASKDYWIVIYTTTGTALQVLYTATVHLAWHNASLLAPSPPNAALALNKAQADLLYASISGPIPTATALATARTIALTGDVAYTSPAFNGTSNVSAAATLASTGVTASTYGSTSGVPVIAVDAKGRITGATMVGYSASNLTGATLASGITASSLTSAAGGTFASGAFAAAYNPAIPGAIGGTTPATATFTDITLGTSGKISGGTNLVEQRNSTNAQAFRVYNTFPGANNEWAGFDWQTTANTLRIGTDKAASGSVRAIDIVLGGTARWQFSTAGHMLASADNVTDIGASTANRLRSGYFGTLVAAGLAAPGVAAGVSSLTSIGSNWAFIGGNSITNEINKSTRIGGLHYLAAEEPVTAIYTFCTELANSILIGGGTAFGNAATIIQFYTASDNVTLTGSIKWQIDSVGNFTCGADGLYDIGTSAGFRPRNIFAKGYVAADWMSITDGVAAPGASAGRARIYVDTADGDLKVIFGDGTIKTIVTDT